MADRQGAGELSLALTGIEPAQHLAAHLEGRDYLLGHRDCRTIARISSGTCAAPLDRERAEAAQLNPVLLRQRIGNRVEDRVDEVLHVLPIQVRVLFGELLNQFGLDRHSPGRSTRAGQTKGPPNAGRGGVGDASGRPPLASSRYHAPAPPQPLARPPWNACTQLATG